MRKDVKLGFTIGGVLLAVLIVYVLVISSGPVHKNEVSLAKPELTPVPEGTQEQSAPAPSPETVDPNKPAQGDAATIDPFRPVSSDNKTDATPDRWVHALETGKVPLLMTETPAPAERAVNPTATVADTVTGGGPLIGPGTQSPAGSGAPNGTAPTNPSTGDTLAAQILGSGPSTQPATVLPAGTKRTHLVQRGESFTTIAAVVYGNGAYYPHLLRANPNIDPKKLRPGMTIVIPDPAEVVVTRNQNSSTTAGTSVGSTNPGNAAIPVVAFDQKTEYRVQPNDSLYKISVKLYGKSDRVDKLYELNKDTIGANPAHLKVGMTLKLPEPPTSSSASAR